MIRKRKTNKGTRYEPLVYNPHAGTKQTARQILGEPSGYTTEREARKVERRMLSAVDDWVPPDRRPITVREWVDRWLEEYPRPKESTNNLYRSSLKSLKGMFGDVPMRDFGRQQAREFALEHRRSAVIARTCWMEAIYEAELEGVVANPFMRLKVNGQPLNPARRRELALTAREVEMLAGCSRVLGGWGTVMRSAVLFSAYTGLRLGELCAMEWDWVNEDRTRLVVRANRSRGGSRTSTKNGKGGEGVARRPPDVIPLFPPARDALSMVPRSLSGQVFTLPTGAALTQSGMGHHWAKVRAAFLSMEHESHRLEELEGLVWHTLRHSASTVLVQMGFSRNEVQLVLRHSNPSLVDSTYTNLAREETFDAMLARWPSESTSGLGDKLGGMEAQSS